MLSADLDIVGNYFEGLSKKGIALTGQQCRQLAELMREAADQARVLETRPAPRETATHQATDNVVDLAAWRRGTRATAGAGGGDAA